MVPPKDLAQGGSRDEDPATLAEYDTAARAWPASMRLTKETGSRVLGEALRVARAAGAC